MCKCLVISFLLLSAWGAACPAIAYGLQNEDADRAKPPKKETTTPARGSRKRANVNRPPVKVRETGKAIKEEGRPAFAEVLINVAPSDSTILLNGVEHSAENGLLARRELQPGTYRVVVRKSGFREKEYELNLLAGRRTPLSVTLEPAPGTVSVAPAVADSTISIVNAETNDEVGRYAGRASDVELSPGRYQVTVSKSGYRTVVREFTVEPDGTVYLEPALEPLPSQPPPTRRRPAGNEFRPDAAMQWQSAPEGKYLILSMTGRSGETASPVGSVDVTLSAGGSRTGSVSGMLTGFPCQVELVRLENVAEYSFVEPPGVANQWGRVVVRVRPKDSKRQMRFLINWRTLQSAPAELSP